MKILLGLMCVIVLLVITVLVVGALLPKHHSVTRSLRVNRRVEGVYRIVRDFSSLPRWRKDVKAVDMLGDVGGKVRIARQADQVPDERVVLLLENRLDIHAFRS